MANLDLFRGRQADPPKPRVRSALHAWGVFAVLYGLAPGAARVEPRRRGRLHRGGGARG